jgi:hypothetical protein
MQPLPVSARIAALARRQHGVVSRDQLLDIGVSRRQIEGWTAGGRLDRLLPGVLRVAGAPATREQALSAALLWAGPHALVSHRSAGELWGYDGVKAPRPEITVPVASLKRSVLVAVHHTRAPRSDRRTRRGLPTTTPERTLIDLAGMLRADQLEIAFESARRERLVTANSVGRSLERLGTQGRHGSEMLHGLLVALEHEPAAESALEMLTARLLRAPDLPSPQRQVEVVAFGAKYRLDFAWPHELVALECDGRKWHEIEGDFERDRQRWSAITGQRRPEAGACRRSEPHEYRQPERLVAELRQLMRDPVRPRVSRRDRGEPSGTCAARANDRSASG